MNLLLYRLKRNYVKDIHAFVAEDLKASIRSLLELPEKTLIVSVPRTRQAKKKYGFDQSEALAKALAERLGAPHLAVLKRNKNAKVQKKMHGVGEREENARGSYLPDEKYTLRGCTVLLLDDVITTGATVAECARVLRKMGAARVIAVSPFISFRHPNLVYEQKKNSREERFFHE